MRRTNASTVWRALLRAAALPVVAMSLLVAAPAAAQVGPEEADPWQRGRDLYRAEQYTQAVPYLIEAIHRDPARGEYYLALARTYYWADQYDLAVLYYDLYLDTFAGRAELTAVARNRRAAIMDERDAANAARRTPATPAALPEAQSTIRAALDAKLGEGVAMTATGGGAVALYQSLLRSGYANPDLAGLRARLRTALLDEAYLFVPARARSMPALSLQEWETQRRRLQLWRELAGGSGGGSTADLNRASVAADVAEGQIAYLNQDFDRALSLFRRAHGADAAYMPGILGALNALYRSANGISGWQTLLADAERAAAGDAATASMLPIYRAAFLARSGDKDAAAATLGTVLGLREASR